MDKKMMITDRTWAEINLDHLVHNYGAFKNLIANKNQWENPKGSSSRKDVRIMAVIKANAYGHGSLDIAKKLTELGINYFAVASLDEAIELRRNKIQLPILVFTDTPVARCEEIVEHNITQTIFHRALAKRLSQVSLKTGKKAKVHVKIDTGMNRVGFHLDTATEKIKEISTYPGVELEGIYTHFACADEKDRFYTNKQFQGFMNMIQKLQDHGIHIPIKHACNSAAAIAYPEMHLDMVRIGIALYGCYPSSNFDKDQIPLKPVMSVKSSVVRINHIESGEIISYGGIFKTERKSRIVTIPIGYADGFTRILTKKAFVLIHGQRVPVVGNICMDQCMVDTTDIHEDIQMGDEVVIFGEQEGEKILAEDLGDLLGTINYEILTMVSRRVPRYYIQQEAFIKRENYLW
jgi:alanine racemase